MSYATLDTDAIGSCRLPAAYCGVVGFKGTYGLVDPKGILEGDQDPGEMIRWFGHPRITTRCVQDTALVLDVFAEKGERVAPGYFARLAEVKKVRVGVADNLKSDLEVSRAFEKAVEIIGAFPRALPSLPSVEQEPSGMKTRLKPELQRKIMPFFIGETVVVLFRIAV